MDDIVGTEEGENIQGTQDADVIRGLGGDDRIEALGGDDNVEGGEGDDYINGGQGDDIIDGGAGDDRLVSFSGTDLLIGGLGNDDILVENFSFDFEPVVNSSVDAGEGDDTLRYFGEGTGGTIDLGAGADTLNLSLVGSGIEVTLGTGIDTINLSNLNLIGPGSATFTDFVAGDAGEVIDFTGLFVDLTDYDGFSNPFGTGHFRLEASGNGSVINFHPDVNFGPEFSLFFANVTPDQFTAHNFGGFAPSGESTQGPPIDGDNDPNTIDGTDLGETISGFDGDDTINAGGGDDTLIGGEGSDTLNGGDGDDLFLFDLTSFGDFEGDPRTDAAINGGDGFDTIDVTGSTQGNDIAWVDIATDLPITSIEGLVFSGNFGLLGTVADFNAFGRIEAPNVRITDNADFTPSGQFAVDQLTLPDGGVSADFSGDGIFIVNIVSGNGDDVIVGPDGAFEDPDPNNSDILVAIDVNMGNDTVIAGNARTSIISDGGNNDFTGSDFDDWFLLFGDGDNTVNAGDGNDQIAIAGVGTHTIFAGGGDDLIELDVIASDGSISGGEGYDRLVYFTGGSDFTDYDLTQFQFNNDIEEVTFSTRGFVTLTIDQINGFEVLNVDHLQLGDGGAITLINAPQEVRTSAEGNRVDLSQADGSVRVVGGAGNDVIIGGQGFNSLQGGGGDDELVGFGESDFFDAGDGVDLIVGGGGSDQITGGSNVDTAVLSGDFADYTINQSQFGVFDISGNGATASLFEVEFVQFDDQTVRLLRGEGVAVNFETDDPLVYQDALRGLRDFDGNDLGGDGAWLRIGSADVNGDGDIDQILVNDAIGRFATVGTAPDGLVYFDDNSWAGETRVAGIYVDPLVQSGDVVAGSDGDSQRRFQNDLQIENINRVLGSNDYDDDGIYEVYFALTDGTAYLRALMHEDGNIRYANYQSEQEVRDYLNANGFGEETYGDWFTNPDDNTQNASGTVLANTAAKSASEPIAFKIEPEFDERPEYLQWSHFTHAPLEYFG